MPFGLLLASYMGVPFHVKNVHENVGRRLVKHEFPNSEEWFVEEAADGFNVLPAYFPGALVDFVDLVVPELQARGLFRREYEGATLRDHFGLPRVPAPARP